jgi:SAM-dependent methyltransferase
LKKSSGSLDKLIKENSKVSLDFGCGANKQKGFIGMDARDLEGVDIVHNIEVFPWPFPDDTFSTILGSHIVEHIKPEYTIALFNELWRVMKVGGQLVLSMPYAGSPGYWQDPTHCSGYNEATFQYYDPAWPLWNIYKPKPWKIEPGFPVWQVTGNMEVMMEKRPIENIDELLKEMNNANV